jgi:hypothetical protein
MNSSKCHLRHLSKENVCFIWADLRTNPLYDFNFYSENGDSRELYPALPYTTQHALRHMPKDCATLSRNTGVEMFSVCLRQMFVGVKIVNPPTCKDNTQLLFRVNVRQHR